jgi:hypothetical protein
MLWDVQDPVVPEAVLVIGTDKGASVCCQLLKPIELNHRAA